MTIDQANHALQDATAKAAEARASWISQLEASQVNPTSAMDRHATAAKAAYDDALRLVEQAQADYRDAS
jgi:hypothetical protein